MRWIIGCVICVFSGNISAADSPGSWPRFRGPNGSGVSLESKPLPTRLDAKKSLWRISLPKGVSSPCIWRNRIFLTASKGDSLETICIDRKVGKILWRQSQRANRIEKTHSVNNPASATPATDGKRVCVYFGSYGLICYTVNGRRIWQKQLPVPKNRHGSASSPVIVDNLVIQCVDQGLLLRPQGSYLLALDVKTGKEVWKAKRPFSSAGWSTPSVWRRGEQKELVVLGRRVSVYGLKEGKERWWVRGLMDYSVAVPVIGDGRLYVHSAAGGFDAGQRIKLPTFSELKKKFDKNRDGQLSPDEIARDFVIYKGDSGKVEGDDLKLREAFPMLDANRDKLLSSFEWGLLSLMLKSQQNQLLAVRPGKSGDVTDSNVVWREKRRLPEVPSALLYRGVLYLIKNGGIVSCHDAKTGKLHYRKRLGVADSFFSSPVAGDGKIYVASHSGVVVVFAAGEEFRILSTNKLGEPVIATPAITDGVIYVRTSKSLYAFGPR